MAIIHQLSKEGKDFLKPTCQGMYLDGECYAFAIALHRGLQWPIVGLMHNQTIRHALVQCPAQDNFFFDARGFVTQEVIGQPFAISPPYVLQEIEEKDLYTVRTIQDMSIECARRMAELLWPNLPWESTTVSKIKAFAEELEALSRRHGLWLRAPLPRLPVMLAEGDDIEAGYELKPTDDGITYTLDRYFP